MAALGLPATSCSGSAARQPCGVHAQAAQPAAVGALGGPRTRPACCSGLPSSAPAAALPRRGEGRPPCTPAAAPVARRRQRGSGSSSSVVAHVFPFDQAWSPDINAASVAPQLFAASLFPYIAFLYYLTRSGKAPKLTLGGFYFLLVFVGATIPAGIYAKLQYGTSLANVDWLHGGAESLLTITNLLIVLGLRQGIREAEQQKQEAATKAAAAAAALQEAEKAAAAPPR